MFIKALNVNRRDRDKKLFFTLALVQTSGVRTLVLTFLGFKIFLIDIECNRDDCTD